MYSWPPKISGYPFAAKFTLPVWHHTYYFQSRKRKIYISFFGPFLLAFYFYSLVLLLDNAVSYGKIQTITLCFCGKEGLKYFLFYLLINTYVCTCRSKGIKRMTL